MIAAGASDDLAYTVGFEHTTASVRGGPPSAYVLRVTTVFHRENGEWKVVHRHADPAGSPSAGDVLQQLVSGPEVTPADVPAPLTSAHMRAGTRRMRDGDSSRHPESKLNVPNRTCPPWTC